VVERDTPVGPTLSLARPITIRDDTCLTCHSTPTTAPAALVKTYGTANGFGWKLHETIGAQVLSLPMEVPLKIARDAYVGFLTILVEIFVVVFVILNLLLHYLVIAPVKRVSAMAEAVSLGEDVEPYVKPGKDEISSLSVAFNRMRESLRHAMEMIK
jgi:HAMP domain-containing protein